MLQTLEYLTDELTARDAEGANTFNGIWHIL